MKSIPLSRLPGTPAFVADALSGECPIDFGFPLEAKAENWIRQSALETKRKRPRNLIVDRILALGGELMPERARNNAEALRDPDTLAVVTGQQVGLAGGPLLTLYKALTTISIARRMEKQTGIRTVPVFWMATSDHNLAEASQIHWINLQNELTGFKDNRQQNREPVGSLKLGNLATEVIEALSKDMPETEFKGSVFNLLRSAYTPGSTFAEAFMKLGYSILGPMGLVMFDPEEPETKKAALPFWRSAAEFVDERLDDILKRSEEIEAAGYKLQVPIEHGRPAIFLHEEGKRRKIVLEGKFIRTRSDMKLDRDSLVKIAEERPQDLSAGVTLRPLLQGWLLPTAAYVAGPHEMAYWAQLNTAFDAAGIPKPAVIPRASMTLLEGKIKKKLRKFDLEPVKSFEGVDSISSTLIPKREDDISSRTFDEVKGLFGEAQEKCLELAKQPEFKGLEGTVETSFRKARYHMERLRDNFFERQDRRHSDTLKHIETITMHLLPAGQPQERVINSVYYFSRYGLGLLRSIERHTYNSIGTHVFLDLEELTK